MEKKDGFTRRKRKNSMYIKFFEVFSQSKYYLLQIRIFGNQIN